MLDFEFTKENNGDKPLCDKCDFYIKPFYDDEYRCCCISRIIEKRDCKNGYYKAAPNAKMAVFLFKKEIKKLLPAVESVFSQKGEEGYYLLLKSSEINSNARNITNKGACFNITGKGVYMDNDLRPVLPSLPEWPEGTPLNEIVKIGANDDR